jgi:hypothetical protein
LFPDTLFADVELALPAQAEEPPYEPPPPATIVLRPEDAAFVHPELSIQVLPRTQRTWEDLRFLLAAGTALLHARGVEEVEQRVLELALTEFPARIAVMRRTRNGVVSTAAASREGQPGPLSPTALELVKRASVERVSLLYLGDRTVVAAPLVANGQTLGALVIEAAGDGPRLGKHHLQLLTGVAAMAAPALASQLELRG